MFEEDRGNEGCGTVAHGRGCMCSMSLKDGIFMASSVENSCQAWNCKIVPEGEGGVEEEDGEGDEDEDEEGEDEEDEDEDDMGRRFEAIGEHGDIEHLRHLLPDNLRQVLKANRMYWMTDRTPHESLPVTEATYGQFFRLVMGDVSFWYEDHSTPNPFGVRPDPKTTKIVKGNKFDKGGLEIVA